MALTHRDLMDAIKRRDNEIKALRTALGLAVRILARDGIRPLEGEAYTSTEREQIEEAAGITVWELKAS